MSSDHDYQTAFAALALPAVITLSLLAVARLLDPRPQDLHRPSSEIRGIVPGAHAGEGGKSYADKEAMKPA